MKPPLHIVTADDAPPKTETVGERVRRLQAEAKELAAEHVRALLASMAETQALAAEIADGGGVYHHGSQEMAQRIANALASQVATLEAIVSRAPQ